MSTTDEGGVERGSTTDGGGVVPPSVTDGNVVPRSVTNQNADFMERAHAYWAEHWHGSLSFREHLAAFAAQECAALEAERASLLAWVREARKCFQHLSMHRDCLATREEAERLLARCPLAAKEGGHDAVRP